MKDVVNLDLSPCQSERELILGQLMKLFNLIYDRI